MLGFGWSSRQGLRVCSAICFQFAGTRRHRTAGCGVCMSFGEWPGWHSSLSVPPDQHKLFCGQLFVRKLYGKGSAQRLGWPQSAMLGPDTWVLTTVSCSSSGIATWITVPVAAES